MTTRLAQAQQKNKDVGVVLSNRVGSHILVELDLGLAFQGVVESLLVFVEHNMLNFLSLRGQVDDGLAINKRCLGSTEENCLQHGLKLSHCILNLFAARIALRQFSKSLARSAFVLEHLKRVLTSWNLVHSLYGLIRRKWIKE